MELYKHLLLTGDCKGSPATFDLGYSGYQKISAFLSETPPPRKCETNHVVGQLINNLTPDEGAVEAREVHMVASRQHQGKVQDSQSQVKDHKAQWRRWKSS